MRSLNQSKNTFTLPEYCIQIGKDPASTHTYVTTSTIPGAGNGLFTSREIQGYDGDKALVGEYTGMTRTKEPQNKEYIAELKIGTKSILIDAWDAVNKCVLCMMGYINDPLDESMENCQWESEYNKLCFFAIVSLHLY